LKLSNGPRENRRRRSDSGFALIIAVWGVGLIAFLILSFVSAANLRIRSTLNEVGSAQASALATAAVNIAILDRELAGPANAPRFPYNGAPSICSLPQGALAAIAVEDERGKIDLNAASEANLEEFFVHFSPSAEQAREIAEAIIEFRTPAIGNDSKATDSEAGSSQPLPPKHAAFQTALELDQVRGVTPDLFARVLPFVTVHSGLAEIDRSAASPILIAILSGAGSDGTDGLPNDIFPNDAPLGDSPLQSLANGTFLIHVDVRMTNGTRQSQEAVVGMNGTDGSGSFSIKEWRRGRQRYAQLLDEAFGGRGSSAPPC
jgi:general secretion pathway protein K